jgi:hypothetical protein
MCEPSSSDIAHEISKVASNLSVGVITFVRDHVQISLHARASANPIASSKITGAQLHVRMQTALLPTLDVC